MFAIDSGEPFGLPSGTVRGVIALFFTGLMGYAYVTTGTIDPTLLATGGPYLGYYFADRQAASQAKAAAKVRAEEEALDPPYNEDPDAEGD